MAISKTDQAILDRYPDTQVALRRNYGIPSNAGIPLGAMIKEATTKGSLVLEVKVPPGGVFYIGNHVLENDAFPVGAIIDKLIVETIITSDASQVLLAICAKDGTRSEFFGEVTTQVSSVGLSVPTIDLQKPSEEINNLALWVFGSNMTTGHFRFYFSYKNPVQK
jgi:hypothetical protein